MNFTELAKSLNINEKDYHENALSVIKSWYQDNVSTDERSDKCGAEAYQDYIQYTKFYLQTFCPLLTEGLAKRQELLENKSPISFAAYYGWDVCLGKILQSNHIDIICEDGFSLLHQASIQANLATVKLLLAHGASTVSLSGNQETPAHLALRVRFLDSISKQRRCEVFTTLKKHNDSFLKMPDASGDTVFHLMCTHNFSKLLEESMPVDVAPNYHGYSLIHCALLAHSTEVLNILLKYPEHAKKIDARGRNAFHFIAKGGNLEQLESLLSSNELLGLINEEDDAKMTPLDYAYNREDINQELIDAFLAHGAVATLKLQAKRVN